MDINTEEEVLYKLLSVINYKKFNDIKSKSFEKNPDAILDFDTQIQVVIEDFEQG